MFKQEEWRTLISALTQQTLQGQIKWTRESQPEGYDYDVDDDTIISVRSVDGDMLAPFEVIVWRRGSASDESLTQFGSVQTRTFLEQWGVGRDLAGDLYQLIVRETNKVSSVFDTIMGKIGTASSGESQPERIAESGK